MSALLLSRVATLSALGCMIPPAATKTPIIASARNYRATEEISQLDYSLDYKPGGRRAESAATLSEYGFDYSWSSVNGWFFYPPGTDGRDDLKKENVTDAVACAEICSKMDITIDGGEYDIDSNECWCYDRLYCLEPCVGLDGSGVEFSSRPLSDFETCEKSFCEYFYDEETEFCDVLKWDKAACDAGVGASNAAATYPFDVSLSKYGYDYSWSAAKGWFFYPPGAAGRNNVVTNHVDDVVACADLCSKKDGMVGGEYEISTKDCFCYDNLYCLEPCVGLNDKSVEFSTLPLSDFGTCNKSFCDSYYDEWEDFCNDPENGWDPTACAIVTDDSNPTSSPFDVSLSKYGYDFSWSAAQGWFFPFPGVAGNDYVVTENVDEVEACAEICFEMDGMDGGKYELNTKKCFCYDNLYCLEPCVDLNDNAVEFSNRPLSDFGTCEKSFCDSDYFGDIFPDYCRDSGNGWDPAACSALISASEPATPPSDASLSKYGYGYKWYASQGWFYYPPGVDKKDVVTEDITDVEACAEICSKMGNMAGGEYDILEKQCWCYDNLYCLEPCAGLNDQSVEFSTRPLSDFGTCDKSFCDAFYVNWKDYCDDPGTGWDPTACAAKIGTPEPVTPLSDVSLSLSLYGFDYNWSSTQGWFSSHLEDDKDHGLLTLNVNDVEACAEICSNDVSYIGGEWSKKKECWCYEILDCLEPCTDLNDQAVEFAKRPLTDFGICAESWCDIFYDKYQDYCDDPDTGYDANACAAKIRNSTDVIAAIIIAEDDSYSIDLDKALSVNILSNDIDPQGDILTVQSVDKSSSGQFETVPSDGYTFSPSVDSNVTVKPNGIVTFNPNGSINDLAEVKFVYMVSDRYGGKGEATVTITIKNITCDLDCFNGGVCHFGKATYGKVSSFPYGALPEFLDEWAENGMYCQCPKGRVGRRCEHSYQICDSSVEGQNFPCFHDSKCADLGNGQLKQWACDCTVTTWLGKPEHFSGRHCEYRKTTECLPSGKDGLEEAKWFCTNDGQCNLDER